MNIKDRIRITERLAARQCLKLFWVFPVDRKKLLFESYDGQAYSCNPKYLSEYLETRFPGKYELIWAFNEPALFPNLTAEHRVSVVRKRSLRWFYEYLTAGVRITNVTTQLSYFPKRDKQLVLNTWHAGGAYKRIGIFGDRVQGTGDFQKWRRMTQSEQINLFLSSSPVFTETNLHAAYNYTGKVLNSGLPRNDMFFDPEQVRMNTEKVRKELGISGLAVMYAPTFRGHTKFTSKPPAPPLEAIVRGIQKRYGQTPVILLREHHHTVQQLPEADEIRNEGVQIVNVSGYPDMQELLCTTDILVTDYSSSIWDYALLGRPCFLYVPDLESYESSDRGFFTPIEDWPGIVCRDEDALTAAISTLDEDVCREKAERHLKLFQSYEQGKACEITAQEIEHFVQTGEI